MQRQALSRAASCHGFLQRSWQRIDTVGRLHADQLCAFGGSVTVTKTPASGSKTRRRRRIDLSDDSPIPSYKEFVHKMTVIHMYRNFLKTIQAMPNTTSQQDLKQQVQREFQAHKQETDPYIVQRAIGEGKRQLTELEGLVPGRASKAGAQGADEDPNSWINTHDPDDPRGRVGEGWPWSS